MSAATRSAGAARTAPVVTPHVQLPLTEELFSAVLQQVRPSRGRVEALTNLALQHPANAVDVWTALRKALISETDLNSTHNQALWYVVDSLLKHAPHIFEPLMQPRLLEYVIQQMPWHLVQWSASVAEATTARPGSAGTKAASGHLMWCERLVRTWEHYLPASIFQPILQHAVHCRSEAELGGALSSSAAQGGVTVAAKGATQGGGAAKSVRAAVHPTDPATPEQLRQLTESWQTFYYWCRALEEQQQRRAAPTWLQQILEAQGAATNALAASASADAKAATQAEGDTTGLPKTSAHNASPDSDGSDDDDYDPEFINGAKPRALPQLDLPKRRREARRRPRDDDDF